MRLLLEIELAPVTLLPDIFFLHASFFRLTARLSSHIYMSLPWTDKRQQKYRNLLELIT
jgi:hypothetical protein